MSDLKEILLLLLGALPYIALLLYVVISGKTKEFHLADVFLGLFGILIALGVGAVGGFMIISSYPQTASTVSDSFLTTVLAVMLGIALLGGELFRYMVLKTPKNGEERPSLSGLAFGVGFSLGEFAFFAAMAIMNWGTFLSVDASLMIAADIVIQLAVSIAAFELIKQENLASVAVGALYFISFFLAYVLNNSVVLNIAAKVIILIISLALAFTFVPKKKMTEEGI